MLKRFFLITVLLAVTMNAVAVNAAAVNTVAVNTAAVSDSDAELISRAVATSYPDIDFGARVGICAVILNRLESEKFPSNVSTVITAMDSGFNGTIIARQTDERIMRFSRDACNAALSGADPTGGALFFEQLPKPTRKDNRPDFADSLDLSKYKVVVGTVGFY